MKERDQEGIDQTNARRGRGGGCAAEGERFECSGAALVADCVALCCCPCAVVSFVAFALVKVPWAVGRRCLAAGKTRRKKAKAKAKTKKKKKRRSEGYESEGERSGVVSEKKGGWWAEEGIMGISSSSLPFEELEDQEERVWWELYQVGHLGFGRVSFTGVHLQS